MKEIAECIIPGGRVRKKGRGKEGQKSDERREKGKVMGEKEEEEKESAGDGDGTSRKVYSDPTPSLAHSRLSLFLWEWREHYRRETPFSKAASLA